MEDLLKFLYNENKLYKNDLKIQLKYTNIRKKKIIHSQWIYHVILYQLWENTIMNF